MNSKISDVTKIPQTALELLQADRQDMVKKEGAFAQLFDASALTMAMS